MSDDTYRSFRSFGGVVVKRAVRSVGHPIAMTRFRSRFSAITRESCKTGDGYFGKTDITRHSRGKLLPLVYLRLRLTPPLFAPRLTHWFTRRE